ncbi:MAG: hypothetical protein LBQ81_11830, partial [Zoogloeaceae bacterium]|nr:hypothetical protein [Zoogloeaceae bacterium]
IPWVIVTLPFRASTFLAELIYMGLDRVLPRRRWPKELLEACDYVWDGSNDRGPISEHAKKAYPHHPVMG